ncbi:MAG: ThuA domain-containing protein [Phycisphaerales bacterium]|nr:MAG: ThuA domain-containing protein [Phycisphaerales bacterium]
MIEKLKAVCVASLLCGVLMACPVVAQDFKYPTAEEVQKMEAAMPNEAVVKPAQPRRMLVIDRCEGFKHSSVPFWDKALQVMGEKTGAFSVVITDDLNMLKADTLGQFDAVCFNNTTQLKLSPENTPELCKSLMDFVKGGKGLVGIHAATDNFYDWPEAMEMMGGKFTGHPWTSGGTWAFKIDQPDHPLMVPFEGQGFKISDEIYRTDPPLYSREKALVLMSLDLNDEATKNARGVREGDEDTGISWIKTWGKGRMFYCSLGHNHDITWTPPILEHYLRGIQFAMGDLKVDTTPKPAVGAKKVSELEQLLAQVKAYDFGDSREALTKLGDMIRQAYGNADKLEALEKALLSVLESDAKYAGKQYVCRELSIIGTGQSVPVLGKMLTDEELSDMARYALERIPDKTVDPVLLAAMLRATGKAKVGIINTLGERGHRPAAGEIGKLVGSSDKLLASAAISALGKIGGPDAAVALSQAKDSVPDDLKMVVYDASLKCADQMVVDGDRAAARKMYQSLYTTPGVPQLVRAAALRGMLNAASSDNK